MEVITYLKIIARYWWLILLTLVISTGVAAAITMTKSKTYTVHVRVVAQPSTVLSDTRTLVDMSGQVGMRSVMGTFAEVFSSADVRSDALKAVGMSQAEALNYPLDANALPDSSVIELTGTGHDPVLLTNYVNATTDAAIKYGNEIFRVIELVPLERATVPQAPTSPVPSRDIPLGAGLGLALGVLLAFATEYVRTPHHEEGEVQIRALPINPTPINREDRMLVNGPQPRQEYLVGRQQRPGSSLPPGRQDDHFPG